MVDWKNAQHHRQNKSRNSFVQQRSDVVPNPAPILQRTPAKSSVSKEQGNEESVEKLLKEIGIQNDEIKKLCEEGALTLESKL